MWMLKIELKPWQSQLSFNDNRSGTDPRGYKISKITSTFLIYFIL